MVISHVKALEKQKEGKKRNAPDGNVEIPQKHCRCAKLDEE